MAESIEQSLGEVIFFGHIFFVSPYNGSDQFTQFHLNSVNHYINIYGRRDLSSLIESLTSFIVSTEDFSNMSFHANISVNPSSNAAFATLK